MGAAFRRAVIEPFVDSYLAGETPLPCANCNAYVKFGELLEAAFRLGAETLATGHYARVAREGESFVLRRGLDREKDQSYFLFALEPWQLEHVRFPLGGLTKAEVRALAAELGLPNASKAGKPGGLLRPGGRLVRPGARDSRGRPASRGGGGGRRQTVASWDTTAGITGSPSASVAGSGVADGRRLYVLEVRPESNRIVVGSDQEASRRTLLPPRGQLAGASSRQARSRPRSRCAPGTKPARATVRLGEDGTAEVEFAEPVLSPAPGQAAVCYDGDRLLGGGWIASTA